MDDADKIAGSRKAEPVDLLLGSKECKRGTTPGTSRGWLVKTTWQISPHGDWVESKYSY